MVYQRTHQITMNIVIKRLVFNKDNCIGEMWVDGVFFAHTLEDKVRVLHTTADKVKNATAIPYGTYTCKLTYSPRFKRELPELFDVPYFSKIRIHGGNTASDSEGCILIGEHTDRVKIWQCGAKVNSLVKMLRIAGGCSVSVIPELTTPT